MFFVGKCCGWKQGYSCFLKNIDYYCWRKEFLWLVGCSSRENSQGKILYRNHFQSKNSIKTVDNGNIWDLRPTGRPTFSSFPQIFFKWLPQKSKHIQALWADRRGKSICKPLLSSLGKDINQHLGSLQHAMRFPVMLWGATAGKAAGPGSRRRNCLCLSTAKNMYTKSCNVGGF